MYAIKSITIVNDVADEHEGYVSIYSTLNTFENCCTTCATLPKQEKYATRVMQKKFVTSRPECCNKKSIKLKKFKNQY